MASEYIVLATQESKMILKLFAFSRVFKADFGVFKGWEMLAKTAPKHWSPTGVVGTRRSCLHVVCVLQEEFCLKTKQKTIQSYSLIWTCSH